jgi:succinate dehydrogenase/fumarate reductase flavoprotein subunit
MCSVKVAVVRLPVIVMGGGGAGEVAVAARINFILSIAIIGDSKIFPSTPNDGEIILVRSIFGHF